MNSREKLQLSVKFGVTDVWIEQSLFWGRVFSVGFTVAENKLLFCDSFIRRNAMPTTKHIIPVVTTVKANTRSLRDIRPSFRSTWVSVLPTESSGKWLPCRSCNSWFNEPIVEWSVCSSRLEIICQNPQSLDMHWRASIAVTAAKTANCRRLRSSYLSTVLVDDSGEDQVSWLWICFLASLFNLTSGTNENKLRLRS